MRTVRLASSAHPVDDMRLFSKVALPLTRAEYAVSVVGIDRIFPGSEHAIGPVVRVLNERWRWRRALVAAEGSMRSGADVLWIADLDVLVWALILRRMRRWSGVDGPAIVCDIHEHFVSRVHDRAARRLPLVMSFGAAGAFDVAYRLLLRSPEVVVAASNALAADLARRGIVALVVENAITAADARDSTSDVEHWLVTELRRRRQEGVVVVHPGRMDGRVDKDAVLNALARVSQPMTFVAIGGGTDERVVGSARYIETGPVARHVLLPCISEADAVFVGFRATRYNELLASSHKLHEAAGLGRQVIVPRLRRWLAAATSGAARVLPYTTGDPDTLAQAFSDVRRVYRDPGAERDVVTIDSDVVAAVELAVRIADPALRPMPQPFSGRLRALGASSRRRVRGAGGRRHRGSGIVAIEAAGTR
jgi:hypothetical protein